MNLKDLVVVSGLPGVQRLVTTKGNGMVVADIDTGKTRFAATRKHQFSPLETISMYVEGDDSVELKVVFENMLKQLADNPPPAANESSDVQRAYFTKILPNHDRDLVHISDIKKAVRWFGFLNERGLLDLNEEEGEGEGEKEGAEEQE